MAGIGFDWINPRNPQNAAKNVQCIHTSYFIGTERRECHQDWIMGKCGMCQPATNDIIALFCETIGGCEDEKLFSHNICPYFYNIAFSHDFIADNYYNCTSARLAQDLPTNFKMGFMERRRKYEIFFDVPLITAHQVRKLMSRFDFLSFQFINNRRYSRTHIEILPIHRPLKFLIIRKFNSLATSLVCSSIQSNARKVQIFSHLTFLLVLLTSTCPKTNC